MLPSPEKNILRKANVLALSLGALSVRLSYGPVEPLSDQLRVLEDVERRVVSNWSMLKAQTGLMQERTEKEVS